MNLLDKSDMPSVNTIVHTLAKAFHSLGERDVQVESVHITPQIWTAMHIDPKGYEILMPIFDHTKAKMNIKRRHMGTWWGADVYMDDQFWLESKEFKIPTPNRMGLKAGRIIQLLELIDPIIEKIRKNLNIFVKTRALPFKDMTADECRAVETLREMISESDYRKYIKYGFILVTGKSGLIYQVSRHSNHTKVWKNGEKIEEICVRITDPKIPPTDNVIARKVLIEESEDAFRKWGNVYKFEKNQKLISVAA